MGRPYGDHPARETGTDKFALLPRGGGLLARASEVAFSASKELCPRPSRAFDPPGLEKADELDFSDSSEEDDIRRRRGTVRKMELDEVPQASTFPKFIQNVYVKVAATSKRS